MRSDVGIAGEHPFHRWVAQAGARPAFWKTALVCIVIVAVWAAWIMLFTLLVTGGGLTTIKALNATISRESVALSFVEATMALGVMLATFWGLWIGVWSALKWLHGRELASVLAHDGRIRRDQFLIGMAMAAVYVALSLGATVLTGATPIRSEVDIGAWLVAFVLLATLVLFQSAGEEVFFRGYLMQRIAARAPHPFVWGFLPCFLFGLIHAPNANGDLQFALFYVVSATMAGLVMTALVWRTGSLAAAMGFHFANNVGALLIVGSADGGPVIAPFLFAQRQLIDAAPVDLLLQGLILAFVLSPLAPLPKGQPLRRNVTRAAP